MHIYDKDFTQTELPMTKQEIRAISGQGSPTVSPLSRLSKPQDT